MHSELESVDWHCPQHGKALHIADNSMKCESGCGFAIRNGIPRFVQSSAYAEAFGLQWLRYRKTQLDSYSGVPVTERRMKRCFGEALWEALPGSRVLEAGCGAGRFTELLLNRGARVVSVDLSEAVDANQQNFPVSDQHLLAQADITALPFREAQFDIVMCLGVIQHTPSPESTIEALYKHVKPGGWLVIDHYTYLLSYFTKTAPLFRAVLRRLDAEAGIRATERLVEVFLPAHRLARHWYPLQALVSRISPVITYYHALPELSDNAQREWAILDTHDSLTDWYKHFRTRGQIVSRLKQLGACEIFASYGGNGVEARARRG